MEATGPSCYDEELAPADESAAYESPVRADENAVGVAGPDAAVANVALEEDAARAGSTCAATVCVSVLEVRSCRRGGDG